MTKQIYKKGISKMNFFTIIAAPFGYLISWLYSLTNNYLLAVLGTAIVFNICFIWTDIIKRRSAKKLASMLPDIIKIQQKYPNAQINKKEKEKMNKEITEVYNKNNYTGATTFILPVITFVTNIIFFTAVINPLVYISGLDVDTINNFKDAFMNAGIEINGYTQFGIVNLINNTDMLNTVASIVPNVQELIIPNLQFGVLNLGETPSFSWPVIILPIIMTLSTLIPIITSKKITINDFKNFNYSSFTKILLNSFSVFVTCLISFKLPVLICIYWLFRMILNIIKSNAFKVIDKIKNRKECLETELQTKKV